MSGRDLALAVFVMAIWGFNYTMIKLGVSEISPMLIAAGRFFCAAFPMVLFVRRPQVPWRYLVGYGLVFGVGIWGMASSAMYMGLSSGMTSVLLQLDVLTTVAVGVLLYREVITRQVAAGIMIALAGVVVSVIYTNGNVTVAGLILIIVSAVCWPLAGVVLRRSGSKSPFAFNIWGMVFAPLPLIGLSVLFYGPQVLVTAYEHWNGHAWLSVLFQAYPTTIFGYWIWNRLVLKYPMSTIAPLTLLTTVFGVLSGWLMFDEQLTAAQWVACSAFLLGIALVVMPPVRLLFRRALVGEV
ncbi:putative amino-acid metabolite efflux pump [Vibrio aerogenes CECT 7868]|uniref:Putative amino-acid metabolite efflux pump n=1 Tax=Vibrio aerogenes CECT 7868 TaxID=1216006 RepID=A0A1M6EVJ3_9VIBR|nr:EamA family transporter [Vibrio aerogenes]SHI89471.1 putative amino-acid metabolite efflux pump [Vibrio aerogenes CECT 7868]